MAKLISAAEITVKYKISYQTLNYYTNLGLLRPLNKKGNKRMFDENQIRASLEKIQKLKNEGYTLQLIRRVLNNESAVGGGRR